MKKFSFPHSRFTFLFAAWLMNFTINILFSDAPAVSLFSLSIFSFFPINSLNTPLNSPNSPASPAGGLFSPALPLSPSWLVTLSSLGASFKNAFLGTGLGNFGNAFTQFRPISFNTHALWFFRFDRASSPALTVLVEQGLLGLFFWFGLFYLIYKSYLSYKSYDQELFFNARERLFAKGFFVLAVLWLLTFLLPLPSFIFPIVTLISLISLVIVIFLFSHKSLPGFRQASLPFFVLPTSLTALTSLIVLFAIFAPRLSPDRFVTQSQINLLAAEKTAADHPADKKTIQKQVAAAIAAATQAINLNPRNSAYQTNLAVIITHLNNILTNAPRLATDHFQKALLLDPANPQLFFEIGRFQFTEGDLYSANQNFQRAVALKKDYAPAWFAVYQTEKKLEEDAAVSGNADLQKRHEESAKIALRTVEELVCVDNSDSEDCLKVRKEKELK